MIFEMSIFRHTTIEAIEGEHWSNAFVKGCRYDMLTNNPVECINNLLKDISMLPVTKQIEEIRAELIQFYKWCRLYSESINSQLTPYAERILSQGYK